MNDSCRETAVLHAGGTARQVCSSNCALVLADSGLHALWDRQQQLTALPASTSQLTDSTSQLTTDSTARQHITVNNWANRTDNLVLFLAWSQSDSFCWLQWNSWQKPNLCLQWKKGDWRRLPYLIDLSGSHQLTRLWPSTQDNSKRNDQMSNLFMICWLLQWVHLWRRLTNMMIDNSINGAAECGRQPSTDMFQHLAKTTVAELLLWLGQVSYGSSSNMFLCSVHWWDSRVSSSG